MKKLAAITLAAIMTLSTSCSKPVDRSKETLMSLELPSFTSSIDWSIPNIVEEVAETTSESTSRVKESSSEESPETSQVEVSTTEETAIEEIIIECTEETTEEPTTEYDLLSAFTFDELDKQMYVQTYSNVRDLPSIEGNKILILSPGVQVKVTGYCREGWYRVEVDGVSLYISEELLADSKYVAPSKSSSSSNPNIKESSGFVYYAVSTGRPDYDLEKYLYNCLCEVGLAWWYPWAVAQIWQESCWSPNSYNGVDAGICQFNEATFQRRAEHHAGLKNANVWDPYTSLYVYSRYIRDILAYCGNDVDAALSYYIKGHWNDPHYRYIELVKQKYNMLHTP